MALQIGGYQVWTQPFLMMVESNLEQARAPCLPCLRLLHASSAPAAAAVSCCCEG